MYQALLTRKYLTTKVMPLLASLGVALCTAMVLITWSVMGGFLGMLTESGRSLIGDVRIVWPNTGFPHYDDLIARLESDPEVEAATPLIETFGIITLPDGRTEGVAVRGVDGPGFARVTSFAQTLWWKPLAEPLRKDRGGEDPRLDGRDMWGRLYENGLSLTRPDPETGERKAAMVLGIEVTDFNRRTRSGFYIPMVIPQQTAEGGLTHADIFLPLQGELTLRVVPLDSKGRPREVQTRVLPVANEFESGLYDIDRQTVLVRFDALQSMLQMNEGLRLADDGPLDPFAQEEGEREERYEVDPARTTAVLVRGRTADRDLAAFKSRVERIYAGFAAAHAGEVPSPGVIVIQTWEDANRTMIAAVKKETALVLFIFSFISMTAVFLVLAIFWAMISEKTRDIGVLRALGAGSLGIAWVWLRYGAAIGLVGSVAGGLLAWGIVANINDIHDWMGESLGLYVWDPAIYVFKEIPRRIEPDKAAFVLAGGVLSCLLGALIPALRAAFMHPIRALRFE